MVSRLLISESSAIIKPVWLIWHTSSHGNGICSLTDSITAIQTSDGLNLAVRVWAPAQPRGLVVVTHGLGEHGGRHIVLAEALSLEGFAVYAMDLRGHGLSEGTRGHTPSFQAMLKDVDAAMGHALRNIGAVPRWVYGHSLGGALALGYGLWGAYPPAGVIATAPWLMLTHQTPIWKIIAATAISPFWPSLTVSTVEENDRGTGEGSSFAGEPRDQLGHRRISLKLFLEFRASGKRMLKDASRIQCPSLIIHGSEDEVTDWRASQSFADRATPNCDFDIWDGVEHDVHSLHLEHLRTRLVQWIDSRT